MFCLVRKFNTFRFLVIHLLNNIFFPCEIFRKQPSAVLITAFKKKSEIYQYLIFIFPGIKSYHLKWNFYLIELGTENIC